MFSSYSADDVPVDVELSSLEKRILMLEWNREKKYTRDTRQEEKKSIALLAYHETEFFI